MPHSLVGPASRGALSKQADDLLYVCTTENPKKSAPLLNRARHIGRDVAALLLHLACTQAPSRTRYQLSPSAEDNGHQHRGASDI